MIYISGSNGLIGKELVKHIDNYISISYRDEDPQIEFLPNSIFIHLSSSTTPRNGWEDMEKSLLSDVLIPLELFQRYLKTNPNGKIIFISTSGDLHSSEDNMVSDENSVPNPKSIYGTHKLLLENYIKLLHKTNNFSSIIFRVTNVYGGIGTKSRVNGIINKLILSDTITITSSLNETINFIHVDDLVNLLLKAVYTEINGHNLFLVGGSSSITIGDLIKKIKSYISVNITYKNKKSKPLYVNVNTTKVQEYFDWKCQYSIDSGIMKQVKSLGVL